ncbi:MAG: bifunctional sulfate adenylyltransferase/adenylylsulfate kinase [Thiothrix sp.]
MLNFHQIIHPPATRFYETLRTSGMSQTKQSANTADLPIWNLTPRQLSDTELLLNGAFTPLRGFLTQQDYVSVVDGMRLASGELWPMPVTLDVSRQFAQTLTYGQQIVLRDPEFVVIALMTVTDIWQPDKLHEAWQVYSTTDPYHPGVDHLLHRSGEYYLGGKLELVELPQHYDFLHRRHTPAELKAHFHQLGWRRILACHTHRPIHCLQQAQTTWRARELKANLLLHPTTGGLQNHCFDHFTQMRCHEHTLSTYPEQTTALSLINLAMRMAGPREALWHALIRKNYGCTHFMVERHHASPMDTNGQPGFYRPEAALRLCSEFATEMGIEIVEAPALTYVPERAEYVPTCQANTGETMANMDEAEFLRRLRNGQPVPAWFTLPTVLQEIRKACPPRHQQGFTVFFTGLSGSGKSTVANALRIKLLEMGGRPVTLLDGDVVRKNLSSELTFSKEHRDLNIRRIGFVASEITKNGGIAICAPIAPYTRIRREVREMIEAVGGFVEVHVSTPLEECERRDRKGLYAKARAGLLKQFTGIDDPYEVPENPELRLDTTDISADECAHQLLLKLEKLGYIEE